MKKIIQFTIIGFVLLSFSISVFGKSNKQIEKELVEHIKNIKKWSVYTNKYDENLEEKLSNENKTFKKKLLKYTSEQPSILKYEFNELKKHLFVSTSEDGKLRVYSWDTETGGTMHYYDNVYQYSDSKSKVYSKSYDYGEIVPKSFITEIFTLKTKRKNAYLLTSTLILSNPLHYQTIDILMIKGNSLEDAKLFKTKSGNTNSIGFQYDFFTVYKRKERPIKLFSFDKSTKTIKFPVVIENEKNPYGKVTKKLIVYKFNGRHFVKVGYQN